MIRPIIHTLPLIFAAVATWLTTFDGVQLAVGFLGIPTTLINAIDKWLDWWDSYSANRKSDPIREEKCRSALLQLSKDLKNFKNILDDRVGRYKSNSHRDAVEKSSFEFVKNRIEPLEYYRSYRRLVKAAIREIESNQGLNRSNMDVARLVRLLEQLKGKLEQELGE